MFVILLKFAADKSRAGEFMAAHKAWIEQGFEDGVFLLVGNLQPGLGGALLAHQATREALDVRVREDPFVVQGIVSPEIIEIAPSRADPRLAFLVAA